MKRTTSKRVTAEIPPHSAVFFSKLNVCYRLKNGKIYVIISRDTVHDTTKLHDFFFAEALDKLIR